MASTLWTDEELKFAIKAYLKMLKSQNEKTPFVKTEINRELQAKINRSKSSIERRFQNISAVLNEHGLPIVNGYLPLDNVGPTNREKIWQIFLQLQNR